MYNVLNYGFPIYLICFELLFRSISTIDTSSFIGPALASSGLSLFISVLKPKEVRLESNIQPLPEGVQVYYQKDQKLILASIICLLIGLMMWYWTCIFSLTKANHTLWIFPTHLVMGFGVYLIGIILSSIKETV